MMQGGYHQAVHSSSSGGGDQYYTEAAQRYAQQAQDEANRQYAPAMHQFRTEATGHMGAMEFEDGNDEDGGDSTRGEIWSDLLSCVTSPLLRLGFLIQCLVLASGFALFYGHGGRGVFSFDLFATPENLKVSAVYTSIEVILAACYALGTFCIACFQIYVTDNAKWTRGFRTGSKLLSTAASLDFFVVALRLMQCIYAQKFLASRWWNRYNQSTADWCLLYAGSFFHAVALGLYGLSFFYLESYHDEGTYEEWAWILLSLFGLAGAAELTLVFTGFGAFYVILQAAALLAALVWACSFEPLLHYSSPAFHDRDISADMDIMGGDAAGMDDDNNGFEEAQQYAPHPPTQLQQQYAAL